MAKIKISISTSDGNLQMLEVVGDRAQTLLGKRIGETIEGTSLGLQGTNLKITGGSDKDGFPMRRDIHGGIRLMTLLGKSIGFKKASKGERRRKLVRGDTITEDVVQVNLKKNMIETQSSPKQVENI